MFLGFTLACLSLLGFKTTTFITLGFPVIILFVPISDTLIAMVRRKLSGKGIMQADRSHLHHILMYKLKLGHRNTVLVLYLVTALFGGCAVLSYFNEQWGMIMLVLLTIVAEIFVEANRNDQSEVASVIGTVPAPDGTSEEEGVSRGNRSERRQRNPE